MQRWVQRFRCRGAEVLKFLCRVGAKAHRCSCRGGGGQMQRCLYRGDTRRCRGQRCRDGAVVKVLMC